MKGKLIILLGALLFISGHIYAQTPANEWQENVNKIKALIKTNPQEASAEATTLLKGKNKKNVDLILAIGNAYLKEKQFAEAEKYQIMAQSANKKNPFVSILAGDIYLAKEDPGTACQQYEQAIYYDNKCIQAYIKYANVYKGANPTEAISKLEELKQQDASMSNEVDRTEAQIYYAHNMFQEAATVYKRFIDSPAAKKRDFADYALTLFFNAKYDESLKIAQLGLEKDARSAVYNRLALWNNANLSNWTEAVKYGDALFNASDSAKYNMLDYKCYGLALKQTGEYDKALLALQKEVENDSTNNKNTYKEISECYEKKGNYQEAINSYKIYLDNLKSEDKTSELYYNLGTLYNELGEQLKNDAAASKKAYTTADSIYAKIAELNPDGFKATLYRARTMCNVDPDFTEGLAKPFYEKVAEKLAEKNDPQYKEILLESYRYLGYYYYIKKQNSISKTYWNKILTIDPTNATAKKALTSIK